MSSLPVRNLIRNFLAENSPETVVDITGLWDNLRDGLAEAGVQPDAPWLGLEFIGEPEEPVSLTANNQQGLYREYGLVQLHVVAPARIGVGQSLETRGQSLHDLFKGRRIGGIIVERIFPLNTGPGATLDFEAGFVSGTIGIQFHYDSTPGT